MLHIHYTGSYMSFLNRYIFYSHDFLNFSPIHPSGRHFLQFIGKICKEIGMDYIWSSHVLYRNLINVYVGARFVPYTHGIFQMKL